MIPATEVELQLDLSKSDPLTAAIMKGAEDAYKLNNEGLDALEYGKFSLAETLFRSAIETLPLYSDAKNNLGVTLYKRGEVGNAKDIWLDLTKSDKDYPLSWFNLGVAQFDSKNYGKSIEFFKKALSKRKRFAKAELMIGRANGALGKSKESLKNIANAWKYDSTDVEIMSNYAFVLIENGDTTKAITVLESKPNSPEALMLRGELAAVRGDYKKATSLLEKSLKKSNNHTAIPILIQIYIETRSWNRAIELIDNEISSGRVITPLIWNSGAIASQGLGKNSEALSYLSRGLANYGDDEELLYNYSQLLYQVGKTKEALKAISRLPKSARDAHSYYTEATILKNSGDIAQAKSAIQDALVLDQQGEYYQLLGSIQLLDGDKEAALIQFKKALSLNPSLTISKMSIAVLEQKNSDYSTIINEVKEEVKKCENSCNSLKIKLAYLYHLNNNRKEAFNVLNSSTITKDEEYYIALTNIYQEEGNFSKAFSTITSKNARATLKTAGEKVLADYLSEGGRYSEGEELAEKLLLTADNIDRLRYLYLIGYNRMKLGQYKSAIEPLEKLIKLSPKNNAANGVLAFVYQKTGDNKSAEAIWKRLSSSDNSNSTILVNLSLSAENGHDYNKALNYIDEAISKSPNNLNLYINKGNILAKLNRNIDAYNTYKKAFNGSMYLSAAVGAYNVARIENDKEKMNRTIKIVGSSSTDDALRVRGNYLIYKNRDLDALTLLRKISEKEWRDWRDISEAYLSVDSLKQAKEALDFAALTGIPEKELLQVKKSIAFKVGDYDKIINELSDSTDDDKYDKVIVLYKAKRYDDALLLSSQIVNLFKDNERLELLTIAANSAVLLKKWDNSLQFFQLLSREYPKPLWLLNIAISYYNLHDFENSYNFYIKAKDQDSSIYNIDIERQHIESTKVENPPIDSSIIMAKSDSLYNTALSFHQNGELEKAEVLYKKILEDDKRYYRAWNNLGAIYGSRGDIDKAIDAYENSVSRRADIIDGYINLVNLYLAIEDYGLAKRWCKKGLKQSPDNRQLLTIKKQLD